MSKKGIKLVLKILISAIFIIFLFRSAGVGETIDFLWKSDHKLLVLGVILYLTGQFVSSYKWMLICETAGFKNTFRKYFDYYLIGMFFNLFLPTTVGGDVTKCYYLSRNDERKRKAPAVYTVLVDRYIGVIIIVWMATIAMFTPIGSHIPFHIKLFMTLASLSIFIITPLFPSFCMLFAKKYKWVRTMLKDIRVYWNNPILTAKTLLWSFIFHLIVVIIHILVGKAVGLNVNPFYYFIVYPLSSIAGFIPLSFNGIGPREATYIFFLSLVGVKTSLAMAFGIFWFGIVLFSSLIGGIFYIKGKHSIPPEEFNINAEEDFEELLNEGIEAV